MDCYAPIRRSRCEGSDALRIREYLGIPYFVEDGPPRRVWGIANTTMINQHTCIKDDGGTPNRRCWPCEQERKAELCACGHTQIEHKVRAPHACMNTYCACTALVKL